MDTRTKLTVKEEHMLFCLKTCIEEHHYVPAVRELCNLMHYKSPSTVQMLLDKLEEKGYIARDDGKSRSIRILSEDPTEGEESYTLYTPGVPFIPTDETKEQTQSGERAPYVSLMHNVLPTSLVAIHMPDESMNKIRIFQGDTVIVAKDLLVKSGDLILVRIDAHLTVREYRKIRGGVQLKAYGQVGDSFWTSEPDVVGKVIGVFRDMVL